MGGYPCARVPYLYVCVVSKNNLCENSLGNPRENVGILEGGWLLNLFR